MPNSNTRGQRILVVGAHPDDEVLGCGGCVARHAALGDTVHVLIVAEGGTARHKARTPAGRSEEIESLRAAARRSAEILGTQPPHFAGLPDNRLDSVPLLDVVKIVEQAVHDVGPAVVYTHHGGDLNIDHRVVHQAVVTACRPLPDAPVRRLYAFETVSSTEWTPPSPDQAFRPARFVDIGAHMDTKLKALEAYVDEMRPFPHARSPENIVALARHRGASVGIEAAEAFMVIREVVR